MNPRFRAAALAWQATYTAGFTFEQLRRRAVAAGEALLAHGWSCLVAYDTRFMGQSFATALTLDLQARGVAARLAAAPAPLPAIYHALDQRQAECALVVTARNAPYYHNGLLLLAPAGATLSLAPTEAPLAETPFPPIEQPADPRIDLRAPYLDVLREALDLDLIRRVALTIFVDAMSGTTAGCVPALLGEGSQTRAIEINRDPDPLFGRVAPLPVEAGLTRLKKLVRESDSHLGLAFSADGAALAVVDKQGDQIDMSELAILLATYLARQYRQKGIVVAPIPAPGSPLTSLARASAAEEGSGLKLEFATDPRARLNELLAQDKPNLVLACTAEGELTLARYAASPDGLLAGMLVGELVARNGGSLRSLIDAQREQLLRG